MVPSEEAKAKAVELKNQGNEAFKKHDWPTAIDLYSKATELDDTEPTYFANRAQVQSPRLGTHLAIARVTDVILRDIRPT